MKRTLFDTSVLVAAMITTHDTHQRALPWLQKAVKGMVKMFVSSHTLAELYAVLTVLPVKPRLGPLGARRLIQENVEQFATVISLSAQDYQSTLSRMANSGLSGGTVYDALILRAGEKAKVDEVLTLNPTDFRRIGFFEEKFIVTP